MKRPSIVVALAMLAALAVVPGVQAAPSTPFTGEWTNIDSGDGSTQHLFIKGGARPQIVYIDEVATSACAGQAVATFTSLLTGFVDGDTMYSSFVVAKCGARNVITRPDRFGDTWVFDPGADPNDPSDDTLTDSFLDVWHRA